MRSPLALCMVSCMGVAGCTSPPSSKGRAAASPALASLRPETFLVQHTEGPVVVSVNPTVPPERLAAVFGITGSPQLVLPLLLPLELVIQNQGTQPVWLSEAGLALELPDGSQSRRLPLLSRSGARRSADGGNMRQGMLRKPL